MAESSSKRRSGDFNLVSKHSDRISDYDGNINSSLIFSHGGLFNIVSEDNPQLSRLLEFSPVVDGERLDDIGTIVSSFHGIVCVVNIKGEDELVDVISLWNPATGESIILPPPPPSTMKEYDGWCNKTYGFGLDAETSSYKLVRLVVEDSKCYSQPLKSQASVYCLSTDSWKVTESANVLNFQETSNPKRPCLNEFYYWLGYDQITENYLILTFNFRDERFGTIPVPDLDIDGTECDAELTLFNEDIAIIDWVSQSGGRDQFKIWVLNGAKESWTRLYTVMVDEVVEPIGSLVDKTFGFSMNGKLISLKTGDYHNIYLYDLHTRKVSVVPSQRTVDRNFDEFAVYKESTVTVKCAIGVKKRAEYEDLLKKIQDFQIYGYAKPVLPSSAEVDSLQEEKFRLQALSEDQKKIINNQDRVINEQQVLITKLKEDLSAKEAPLREKLVITKGTKPNDAEHSI